MKFAHIRVSEYFTFAEQIFHSGAISLARKGKFRWKKHTFVLADKCVLFSGWGVKNRTFPARVKDSCPTTRLHPNIHNKYYITKIDDVTYKDSIYYRLRRRNGGDEILVREDILDKSERD